MTLPNPDPIVLSAPRFGVRAGEAECPSCQHFTTAHCLVLEGPVELTGPDDYAETLEGPLQLCHLANVSPRALEHVLARAGSLRELSTQPSKPLVVVCGHCSAVVPDWDLHTEPDGPFFSPDFDQVHWIDHPITCEASYTDG